jgi:hypothetical protein
MKKVKSEIGEVEMKRLPFVLMIVAALFAFMHTERLPAKARTGGEQSRIQARVNQLETGKQAEAGESDGWVIECVDCPKQFEEMTDRSLRVDADGHFHIAYGEDHLYYAWHDGMEWHYETVDYSPKVGSYASLALDGEGYPHISYTGTYYGSRTFLKYAYRNADGWVIETVDAQDWVGKYTSLALDAEGNPHISYTGFGLRYACKDESGWQIQQLVDDMDETYFLSPWRSSLALDEAGYPHISYYDVDNEEIGYANQGADEWHFQTVDEEGSEQSSIVLDGDGYPHISYYSYSDNHILKYASKDMNGWDIHTVDSQSGGASVSIAMDADGYPHISYYDRNNDNLKYAYQNAGGWEIQIVDSQGYVGVYNSLVLDSDGQPSISYLEEYIDNNLDALKFASLDESGWHFEIIDTGGSVGIETSLALDEKEHAHISYFDYGNGALKYAYRDASGWHTQSVESGINTDGISLTLDDMGYPHISYFIEIYPSIYELRYAYLVSTGWHTETVEGETGIWHTSLVLANDGNPHISYYGYPGDLKYAYKQAGDWHIETVDADGDVGDNNSLDLDKDGYPHISYTKTNNDHYPPFWYNRLRYAHKDRTGWNIEQVDCETEICEQTSLTLDNDGNPHISYLAHDAGLINPHLKYAKHNKEGWNILTLSGATRNSNSLDLDGDGYPHISFNTENALMYTYLDETGWHIRAVDSLKGVGDWNSLVLDGASLPHISYYDGINRDLKYAYRILPFYEVTLSPLEEWKSKLPGSTITYTLQVTNTGQVSDSFNVYVSSNEWLTTAPETVGPLAVAESALVEVMVMIPSNAAVGKMDTATITIASGGDNSQTRTTKLNTVSGHLLLFFPIVKR